MTLATIAVIGACAGSALVGTANADAGRLTQEGTQLVTEMFEVGYMLMLDDVTVLNLPHQANENVRVTVQDHVIDIPEIDQIVVRVHACGGVYSYYDDGGYPMLFSIAYPFRPAISNQPIP